MSSRRQILEDSGDSESEGAGSSSFKFLTQDQVSEIEGCNINAAGDGTYSANAMSLAISQNEANLIQLDTDDSSHDYQQYQVLKDKTDAFLSKPIWIRSGEPSEEVLLLEIEALRRSSKRTKITMFKYNSKTGGQVIFGPWWNHALQRIVQISSDNSGGALDWERYTAGRILLSLLAFVTESTDVVKKGKLADLKSTFGVDWGNNVKTARKVINRCATDTILDEQLTKCELHVDSLRGAPPSAESETPVPSSISVKKSPHNDNNDRNKEQEVEEKKKRDDEARKKRMAAMKACQRRASAFSASIEQSRTKTDPAPSATTSVPVFRSVSPKIMEQRPQDSVPQNDTQDRMKPPPPRFIPPAQPVAADNNLQTNQFHNNANKSSLYSSLSGDTKVETANSSFAPQGEYSRGQSHEPKQPASFDSYDQTNQNSRMRYQGSRDDDLREKDYRSQYAPREDRNYRYNDRKRSDRYERPYSRDNSREHNTSRNHGNSRDYDDERPQKRFRGPRKSEQSSTSFASSASNGRGSETRQSPQASDNENSRHEKLTAFAAPGAGRGRGRGRGGVDNRPAWMTKGQSTSNSNTPTPLPTIGKESAADPVTSKPPSFTAPVASAGRGRGRGGVDNRPAWMTKGLTASNSSSTSPKVDVTELVVDVSATVASVGRGRGRGGIDNRPAWMTKGQNDVASKTAVATPNTVPQATAGGMGRGRGRGIDNRPAWMSQQDKNN